MDNGEDTVGAADHFKVIMFSDVVAYGKEHPVDFPVVTADTPYTLCYTSGTTGDPKGAIITHGGMLSCLAALKFSDFKWTTTDRHLSYLPLAHIYERAIYNCCAFEGGSIGVFGGNVKLLT